MSALQLRLWPRLVVEPVDASPACPVARFATLRADGHPHAAAETEPKPRGIHPGWRVWFSDEQWAERVRRYGPWVEGDTDAP